jgi:hypothetical protein
MVHQSVALWEPDITPPDEWLIPSVLYQEAISTFSPLPEVDDRDGRESHRLRQLLGSIYQPLSLASTFGPRDDADQLVEMLRGCLASLTSAASSNKRRTRDGYLEQWLIRRATWKKEVEKRELRRALHDARETMEFWQDECAQLNASLERCEERLAAQRLEVDEQLLATPGLQTSRQSREAALGPLIAKHSELVEGPRGWDPGREAAIRQVERDLKALSAQLAQRSRPVEVERHDAAVHRIKEILAERTSIGREFARAWGKLRSKEKDYERLTHAVSQIGNGGDWLLDIDDHWEPPLGLETIARGKLWGEIFDFLCLEGGLWPSRAGGEDGTLVGPTVVVEEILSCVAEWYCGAHTGWVPMSRKVRSADLVRVEPATQEDLVTLCISWVLPVPANSDLDQAIKFRMRHGDELRIVRENLALQLPDVHTESDLTEIVALAQSVMKEPRAEIERALELDQKVGLRHVRETVFHKAKSGTRNLIGALAAGAVATPVLGNTIELAGLEATVGGGVVISCLAVSAASLWAWRQRRIAQGNLSDSPYRYVYEANKAFGAGGRVSIAP